MVSLRMTRCVLEVGEISLEEVCGRLCWMARDVLAEAHALPLGWDPGHALSCLGEGLRLRWGPLIQLMKEKACGELVCPLSGIYRTVLCQHRVIALV